MTYAAADISAPQLIDQRIYREFHEELESVAWQVLTHAYNDGGARGLGVGPVGGPERV